MTHKLKYLFLLAAMVCGAAWAQEKNCFYFNYTLVEPGETASVEILMKNTATNLTCLEAEIRLPESLSVVCDENGDPIVTLYHNRTAVHEVLSNVLDNGNFKVLVSSTDGAVFQGNEGPFLSFTVRADENAPTGEYAMETVGESLLVNTAAEAFYSLGVLGYVMITDDPTSISLMEDGISKTEESIYNLAGQRLSKKQKGINIVGGRKIIEK